MHQGFYNVGGDEELIEFFKVPKAVALYLGHLNLDILNPGKAKFTSIHRNKLHKKSRHNHSIKDFGGGEGVDIFFELKTIKELYVHIS